MNQRAVQPGDSLLISRDIYMDQVQLFRAGYPVTILDVRSSPESTELYYQAQSQLTGENYYLRDSDLTHSCMLDGQTGEVTARAEEIQKENKSIDFWGEVSALLFVVSIVAFYLLGGAMLLCMILDLGSFGDSLGSLFFPFGLYLVILPFFLLGIPRYQRSEAVRKYDQSRASIPADYINWAAAVNSSVAGLSQRMNLPGIKSKNLCWRCGFKNGEDSSRCDNCGAELFYAPVKNLIALNIYLGTLVLWATVPFLFVLPILFGDDPFKDFLIIFFCSYAICVIFYLLTLFPLSRMADFNFKQFFIAAVLIVIPPLSIYYLFTQIKEFTSESPRVDLNHFRRSGDQKYSWDAMDEKQSRAIIIVFNFDYGEVYKYKPEKRIKYLKQATQLDPWNHRALYHLSREYVASGNLAFGLYEIDNALALFPTHAQYLELKTAITGAG